MPADQVMKDRTAVTLTARQTAMDEVSVTRSPINAIASLRTKDMIA